MKFGFGKKTEKAVRQYDKENYRPVLKCSICTGEQVAGFKEIHGGKFEEVMLIRNAKELEAFMQLYDVKEIIREY
ncbi:MAG: aspartate dehydrogenase [Lachnospiraceae bacterium]|nr:aspartate dehydrogenase [Lachnospiraceae bacterium]MDE7022100.1 aspartate dehydrogenase [Lachnospiraceae bacterium]